MFHPDSQELNDQIDQVVRKEIHQRELHQQGPHQREEHLGIRLE